MAFQDTNYLAEELRLLRDKDRNSNWKRWGPYLSERQWATVREDYSPNGDSWTYVSHDQSRSYAYRWGEDGILGITDRQCRLCFGLAMWNEADPILKERLFGLIGAEGPHGEDAKELYYYLDSTPTHSYMKGLYKYPIQAFPYNELVQHNRNRSKLDPEYELLDTGILDHGKYFDVFVEYAKSDDNDILIKVTVHNRSSSAAPFHLLPTLWFRNTWTWGCDHEGCTLKPVIKVFQEHGLTYLGAYRYETLENCKFYAETTPEAWLVTDNETNTQRLYGTPNEPNECKKDSFHRYVIGKEPNVISTQKRGTKATPYYKTTIPAGGSQSWKFRLVCGGPLLPTPFGDFDAIFTKRLEEADEYYAKVLPSALSDDEKLVSRQAYAGLLWSKQFYHYIIKDWLKGDRDMPPPPEQRLQGRNRYWQHLYTRDVISMPDKWEYPWFATWDLAFHMLPMARVDPFFAKEQLVLFLREWYMAGNGALPAYEFDFDAVNPPVHAWACLKVYRITGDQDHQFLLRVFQKLLLNFTWWVNRKDVDGNNIFSGGFLGLDNISIFDRSEVHDLEQADATSWMAFFCSSMLNIAIELAAYYPPMEDIASKFFEHFVAIIDAINTFGGNGLWDEEDGFYYDQMRVNGMKIPLRIRSMVGLIPITAVNILYGNQIEKLSGFKRRMDWFIKHKPNLSKHISCENGNYLLSLVNKQKLERILKYVLDEGEFLSEFGVRSLSKYHEAHPYKLHKEHIAEVKYIPGESDSSMFGGNSNWRGPIWFPVNTLIIESLNRFHRFFGDSVKVQFPTGSDNLVTLQEAANELSQRLVNLFLLNNGKRPCHGDDPHYEDPQWRDLVLFYEYFHGDTGKGLGASHQTGWTALTSHLLHQVGTYIKANPNCHISSALKGQPGGTAASAACPSNQ